MIKLEKYFKLNMKEGIPFSLFKKYIKTKSKKKTKKKTKRKIKRKTKKI